MITRCLIAAGISLVMGATAVAAQTCGGVYTVKRGDSLSLIADSQYKDAKKWSAIHQGNIAAIGSNPDSIRVGQKLRLTCIGGLPQGLEGGTVQAAASSTDDTAVVTTSSNASAAVQVSARDRKIKLVTADDYAPFTDRKLPGGGLITEVVDSAMKGNAEVKDFGIYVVNDWSAHLDPLLTDAVMDLAYPWYKPDCKAMPDNWRCQNLHFSEPMFEILVLLFTSKERPLVFNSDADMEGKTLCRPKGFFTHDLEGNGRLWLTKGLVKLEQPITMADCFELLEEGKVDAVAINEFSGRTAMKELNLEDKVDVVQSRPLSIEGLHVVVGKSHPQAEEMLELINTGLDGLKRSGDYQRIVDSHMTRIWESF
ncbi:transporter substrate-binding domain-containing protein [Amylibacter sp. IMCC11727]|uniref:LysM peptidoglycan-binding domain-containing protein n=1 Tax=Amylibacter sp. IMCC11727 TaxID=3039851 RepID=UPI00244D9D8B|nr:transporter substrate-binding domain-containing protein [Amylibacter sp. IMCC11727]WGI21407.1 transporter substrate-binding domain-containing protein [Amylibacter sp. IMCC11727]